ncbi:MAG: S-adenosyl-l-methionine hydroxide adenosyltransferase family protein [Gammaproteobacteria bacterium]
MIVLFTDYGERGPYVGQLLAVLAREAPAVPVINLLADAPRCNPRASSYLLPAYVPEFPEGTVFLCVVDPGVGSAAQRPVVAAAFGRHFVGPDNGLFDPLLARDPGATLHEVLWRPATLSASFHGRDLYAPVAACLAAGRALDMRIVAQAARPPAAADIDEVIYVDAFGNAMTGRRACTLPAGAAIAVGGVRLPRATTFSDVPADTAFWYENANGLVEIAVNQGRADAVLGLAPGTAVCIR